jgi:hypothetical protein
MGNTNEVAPRDAVKGMARRTDFAVYLIASPDARMVKGVEKALVRPRIVRRVEALFAHVAGVHFREEREGAVEMGVPGNRTSREE